MRWIFSLLVPASLLGAALLSPTQAAEAPVLAVLEHTSGLFGKRTDVLAKPGVTASPLARKPTLVWTLRDGKTLKQQNPPADRIIQFYRATEKDPELVCTVVVHYARSSSGWRPAYQLVPPPTVTVDNGKLIPVDTGLAGSIRAIQTASESAEGFVYTLRFGSNTGPIQIDLWDVQ